MCAELLSSVHSVSRIFISLLLILAAAPTAWAQDVYAVELQIERLRAQLRDVVDLEAQLQDRAARLDEDLRPENVERSVATGKSQLIRMVVLRAGLPWMRGARDVLTRLRLGLGLRGRWAGLLGCVEDEDGFGKSAWIIREERAG
jgi:hypothetical protein